jgi:hypothetical protein
MKKTYLKPTLARRDMLVNLAATIKIPSDFQSGQS